MTAEMQLPRTYNQAHVRRPYTEGRRRFTIYWGWSYPEEANREIANVDNRFNSITEVKRAWWPNYEGPQFSAAMFVQGIAGTLELFHLAMVQFQTIVGDATGHPVAVYQRVDQAGRRVLLDEKVLYDTDTLMIFGLDHLNSEQEPEPEEVEAVQNFLKREGSCLILGPHHDVGVSDDLKVRAMEYAHHGDPLVPRQQRFSRFTRGLMKALGVPVENQHGLRPAFAPGTRKVAPLTAMRDLDPRHWLDGVEAFSFHMHLPHYAVTSDDPDLIRVLARTPIDMTNPHPFTLAGNTEFNSFVWMPPNGTRGGDILLTDSTAFSTLAGADESLKRFWRNLALN